MLKSLYFLLYLLIIPTVFAGKGRTDFSIFIDQEDELFLKAGLIVPDGRSWLKQSLLWGPASLANYVQLIKQKKNRPVVDHEKLVKATWSETWSHLFISISFYAKQLIKPNPRFHTQSLSNHLPIEEALIQFQTS